MTQSGNATSVDCVGMSGTCHRYPIGKSPYTAKNQDVLAEYLENMDMGKNPNGLPSLFEWRGIRKRNPIESLSVPRDEFTIRGNAGKPLK